MPNRFHQIGMKQNLKSILIHRHNVLRKVNLLILYLVHFVIDSYNRFNGRAFIEMESEDVVKDFIKKFEENN